ncbi:MAG TPA: Uma2 family endonuclease [Kofleriaceae bacterium]|jgi:Uma2 family endonuclease
MKWVRVPIRTRVLPEEYLAWEREQTEKHEYYDGSIYAMSGGSLRHSRLGLRMLVALERVLAPRGCVVFTSDMRVGIDAGRRYVYPDATVVCGAVQTKPGAADVLVNPTILVEVVSPSSENVDRHIKWSSYRRLASLTDYVLVSQLTAEIEIYSRTTEIPWRYQAYGPGERVVLANGAELSVDEIYAGVFELPPPDDAPPPDPDP